jgi:hypothetical protein
MWAFASDEATRRSNLVVGLRLARIGRRVETAGHLASIGLVRSAKASSEGWCLCLHPNSATSTPEVQLVAFKATEEEKESTPSRLPIDASKLDNEEMALIIKSFHQILKQRRGKDYKSRSKKVCYRCGKFGHFIAKCLISSESDRDEDKKGKKKEKKRYYKKKGDDAHVCREWNSDESSTDSSSDEYAINKGFLFPNVGHKCLMAKDGKKKKVHSRATPKYTTSSDEGSSSDDEDNLMSLFANLSIDQKKNIK